MWRVVVVVVVAAGALAAPARAEFPGQDLQLVSRNAAGAGADAPARNAVISQDKRFGRVVAFESSATNLVARAGGGSNVYVVRRAAGYGDNGTPWQFGAIVLASAGMNGRPADGPSGGASLGGTSRVGPRCVAFVSGASNLVPGDTNGRPDAFVRNLLTGRTVRVSVDSRGRQSGGSVSEVAINGLCTRVAFVSDGGDLALTSTRNRSWRSGGHVRLAGGPPPGLPARDRRLAGDRPRATRTRRSSPRRPRANPATGIPSTSRTRRTAAR